MKHTELATKLGTSARTLGRHRQALEARYGIQMGETKGREYVYHSEYVDLLKASIEGRELPESISVGTPFEAVEPEVIESEVIEEPTSSIVTYKAPVREEVALATRKTVLNDTSALSAQTGRYMDQAFEGFRDLEDIVGEFSNALGQKIGATVKNNIAYHINKAAQEAIQTVAGGQ